jgi:hypothetical protein
MGSHNVRTHQMQHVNTISSWPVDGSLKPKHFANYVLINYTVLCLNKSLIVLLNTTDRSYQSYSS